VDHASGHISISAFFQQPKHSEHAKAKIVSSLPCIIIGWIVLFDVFVFVVLLVLRIFIFLVLFHDLFLFDFTSLFVDWIARNCLPKQGDKVVVNPRDSIPALQSAPLQPISYNFN
jgi:hypothetical protein